jgi:tetratricopeptide (TPR) repeat protein
MSASSGELTQGNSLLERLLEMPLAAEARESALYMAGQLAATDADWPRVLRHMRQLRAESSNRRTQFVSDFWIAESLYREGQYSASLDVLQTLDEGVETELVAGRRESWLGMIPLRRAQCLAQLRRWDEAAETARDIASRFPEFRQAFEADYLLGRYHAAEGQFDLARQAYLRVIQSADGAGTETAAMAQWMIGETYFHQENFDEALLAYAATETAHAYPRWQAAAALQAGKAHELLGNHEAAIGAYARLIYKYSDSPYADQATQRMGLARAQLIKSK